MPQPAPQPQPFPQSAPQPAPAQGDPRAVDHDGEEPKGMKAKLVAWVAAPGPLQASGMANGTLLDRVLKVGGATIVLALVTLLFATGFRASEGAHGDAVLDVIMAPFFLIPWYRGHKKFKAGAKGVVARVINIALLVIGALLALDAARFLLI